MSKTTYTSPVDKLLSIGEPESVIPDNWLNYLTLVLVQNTFLSLFAWQQTESYVILKEKYTKMRIPIIGPRFMHSTL